MSVEPLRSHSSPPASDGKRPKSIAYGIWTQRSQILPAHPAASSQKALEPPSLVVGEPLTKAFLLARAYCLLPMRPSQMALAQWHRPTLHISVPRVLGKLASGLERPHRHLRKTVEIRRSPKQEGERAMLYSPSGKAKREATCHRGGATRQSGPQGKVTGQVLEDTSGKEDGWAGSSQHRV